MSKDEFLSYVDDKLLPPSIERIATFERKIGGSLPDDYKQFLLECNGGYVGGALWYEGVTPEGFSTDAGVNSIGGLRDEEHLSLDWHRECYQGAELRIPRDLIWIMHDPFGNAICLGINGVYRGQVYFWDHEMVPDPDFWDGSIEIAENIFFLANTFTDFVAGLHPTPDD